MEIRHSKRRSRDGGKMKVGGVEKEVKALVEMKWKKNMSIYVFWSEARKKKSTRDFLIHLRKKGLLW